MNLLCCLLQSQVGQGPCKHSCWTVDCRPRALPGRALSPGPCLNLLGICSLCLGQAQGQGWAHCTSRLWMQSDLYHGCEHCRCWPEKGWMRQPSPPGSAAAQQKGHLTQCPQTWEGPSGSLVRVGKWRLWGEAAFLGIPCSLGLGPRACVQGCAFPVLCTESGSGAPTRGTGAKGTSARRHTVLSFPVGVCGGCPPTVPCLPACDSKHCFDAKQIGSN